MKPLTVVLLGAVFVAEAVGLLSLFTAGWHAGDGVTRFVFGALAFVAGAVVWGIWCAPKSRHRLHDPALLVVEIAWFLVAAVCLAVAVSTTAGVALAVVAVVLEVAMRLLGQEGAAVS